MDVEEISSRTRTRSAPVGSLRARRPAEAATLVADLARAERAFGAALVDTTWFTMSCDLKVYVRIGHTELERHQQVYVAITLDRLWAHDPVTNQGLWFPALNWRRGHVTLFYAQVNVDDSWQVARMVEEFLPGLLRRIFPGDISFPIRFSSEADRVLALDYNEGFTTDLVRLRLEMLAEIVARNSRAIGSLNCPVLHMSVH